MSILETKSLFCAHCHTVYALLAIVQLHLASRYGWFSRTRRHVSYSWRTKLNRASNFGGHTLSFCSFQLHLVDTPSLPNTVKMSSSTKTGAKSNKGKRRNKMAIWNHSLEISAFRTSKTNLFYRLKGEGQQAICQSQRGSKGDPSRRKPLPLSTLRRVRAPII
jgi:hypothetical protein